MKELLLKLIIQLKAMNLAYHNAHHVASKVAFFSDHDALGGFYSALDADYDSAVERMIGVYGPELVNISLIISQALPKLQAFSSNKAPDNSALFMSLLQMEKELLQLSEMICKSPDCLEADKQLFSEYGNQSRIRQYKIQQRVRK